MDKELEELYPEVKLIGNYPKLSRVKSGLFSLDLACSDRTKIGMPLRAIYELYGHEHVGKSTLAYYLSSKVQGKDIMICDLEGLDPDYVMQTMGRCGFKGNLHLINSASDSGEEVSHEEMLMEMLHGLESLDDGNAAIVDSVSAIMPIIEREGELNEAFIGARAKLVSKMARKAMYILKNKTSPAILFVINHKYAIIPGMGSTTAGGNVLKNSAVLRANIWIDESITDSDKNLLATVVTGVTEKLRYGGAKRRFKFVIVPGVGVSRNLTAVIDCVDLGLATRGATMKIGEASMGRISALIEQESNDKKFEPFYNELVKYADSRGYGYELSSFGI